MRNVWFLLGTASGAWMGLAGPAVLWFGQTAEVTLAAWLICLVPNLAALAGIALMSRKSALAQTGVVMTTFLLRPLATAGLGFMVYWAKPEWRGQELAFVLWAALFYLIMLAAESYVVARAAAGISVGR